MKSPTEILQQILKFCQLMLAALWIYQGLVPKLIFQVQDEQYVWQILHIPTIYIGWMISLSGIIEIFFGSLFLLTLILAPSHNIDGTGDTTPLEVISFKTISTSQPSKSMSILNVIIVLVIFINNFTINAI